MPGPPDANHTLWEKLYQGSAKEAGILGDEMVAQLRDEPLIECGRVLVVELGPNFKDDELLAGFCQEFFEVIDDNVHEVGFEAAVAYSAIFLHADV